MAAKLDNNTDVIISPLDYFKTMEIFGNNKVSAILFVQSSSYDLPASSTNP